MGEGYKMRSGAIVVFLCLAAAIEAATIDQRHSPSRLYAERRQASTQTCLSANALQTGSQLTGQLNGVPADGQVNSETDPANFINVCAGKVLTNGLQIKNGSCNGVPMGRLPATTNMVSTVIVSPQNSDILPANQTFNVTVNIANMQLGSFTNATSTYYAAPQDLNAEGNIIGHVHITIQSSGDSLNPTTPLDPTQFVFFKGINDAGNGQGLLTTAVTSGLPEGNYRVCTMTSASNHQPVLMPVAQRGAQDDCRYFTVQSSGSSSSSSSSTNSTNNNSNASLTSSQAATPTTSSSLAATTTTSSDDSLSSPIGGIDPPVITSSGDVSQPFEVNGNKFANQTDAIQSACSAQSSACTDAINSGKVTGFTVADCSTQEQLCNSGGEA